MKVLGFCHCGWSGLRGILEMEASGVIETCPTCGDWTSKAKTAQQLMEAVRQEVGRLLGVTLAAVENPIGREITLFYDHKVEPSLAPARASTQHYVKFATDVIGDARFVDRAVANIARALRAQLPTRTP